MVDAPPHAVPPPEPWTIAIEEGVRVRVRPLGPGDEGILRYGLEHLSAQSSYHRFLSVRRGATDAELRYLAHPDRVNHLALGAEVIGLEGGLESGVGVARSIFLPDSGDMAEYAIAVADAFQGLGIGGLLLECLASWAYATGVRRWLAVQLASNTAIVHVTSRVATEISRTSTSDGVIEVVWRLHDPPARSARPDPSTRDPRE